MNVKSFIAVIAAVVGFFVAKYAIETRISKKRSKVEIPEEYKDNEALKEMVGAVEENQEAIKNAKTIDDALRVTEETISKTLPLKVDGNTTLVRVKAGPGKLFTYEYTVTGIGAMTGEELKRNLRPHLERQYNGPNMRSFKQGGVVAVYKYAKADGTFLCELEIKP